MPCHSRIAPFARGLTLTLALLLIAVTSVAAQGGEPDRTQVYYVADVHQVTVRSQIAATGANILEVGHNYVLIEATDAELEAVRALGLDAQTPTGKLAKALAFPPADSAYHDYAEMVAELQAAAARYPAIFRLFSIGESYEGRTIWAGKLSKDVTVDRDVPEVLFTFHQHAREHLTVEMGLYILRMLTTEYNINPDISALVDGREVWMIFDMNPDGGEYDIASGVYRSWRKNRQPNTTSPAVGTDLNRNWGYRFGCCGGSSGDPASETYRGLSGFSAPETQVARDFVNSRVVNGKQQITVSIDFHTFSELILWPYGYTYAEIPSDMTQDDHDVLVEMGRAMAATNDYTAEQSSQLYITDGSIPDWLYGQHGILAYTFEMYPTSMAGGGFYPPDEIIPRETSRNREAVLYLLDQADCPYRVIGKEQAHCGVMPPAYVYHEGFDGARTWTVNPDGTDTATSGRWEIGAPQATRSNGTKQPGRAQSVPNALVTGLAANVNVNGGLTTARSAPITLPNDASRLTLTWYGYMAHDANSTNADTFVVKVLGDPTLIAYKEMGAFFNANASWTRHSLDLTRLRGQTIYLQVECGDETPDTLVECGVDSVAVTATR
ncbi:MAG: zinc carboxypeptidase [Anaerolineae bacterium]|nr:zinc carboxypeptidase [Anaerolineae bacterium]